MNPQTIPLTTLLLSSTILAISSGNLLIIWTIIELNTITFTPIILSDNNSTTAAETSVNYLIPQTLGSSLFIISTLLTTSMPNLSPTVANTALLINLGSVPFHGWYPSVIRPINLTASFILMTWQNITPLLLLSSPQLSHTPVITISATISALWGSIAGLNQTNLLTLIAFSSISHLGWLLTAAPSNLLVVCTYLLTYTLTVLQIILLIHTNTTNTHSATTSSLFPTTHSQVLFATSLLSLAGLPPLAVFSANLLTIITLINSHTTIILVPLLLSSTISLYFYLSLILTMTTSNTNVTTTIHNTKNQAMENTHMLLLTIQLVTLPLLTLTLS